MDNKIKAIIVDDEPWARSDFKAVLSDFETIVTVGEASSLKEAITIYNKFLPELIFLDINLPGENGFDLLNHVDDKTHIVFVTAYNEFAVKAFETNALDYLLKPVDKERLKKTIDKINAQKNTTQPIQKTLEKNDSIFIKLTNNFRFLKICSIVKIEAADDYSVVFTDNGEDFIVLKPIKEWELRLPQNTFRRIHRSTIVNIDFVTRVEPWFNNSFKVYLSNIKDPVTLSRKYFNEIKECMG